MSEIDISRYLKAVEEEVKGRRVPVVDLIAVQTREPFKVLVATILSARTRDEVTAVAAARLFARAPTVEALAELSEEEIAKLVYPVGFYKNKAKHLCRLPAAMAQFNNRVPETIEELLRLPGVGRKTANLVVSVAFGLPAICVDTHVHRIMNLWGYVKTDTPEKTETALRKKLPQTFWIRVNSLLVRFGQSICRPIGPHCDQCPLERNCAKIGVTPRRTRRPKTPKGAIQCISWNVNGIRAVEKKGFVETLLAFDADIIGLQETKAQPDQLSDSLKNIPGYTSFWHSAERKGYSGVALYTRLQPLAIHYGIGEEQFDCEGRVLGLEFENFHLITIYFPNAGAGLKRLEYKLAFNAALARHCKELEKEKDVILCGDFNVAHKEIDLKNPKSNEQNPGFTPEERRWMDGFLGDAGYIDTFRMFNQQPDQYSWWSYRFNARAKNIGWRIDYFCVNSRAEKKVLDARIMQEITGSDHCPVSLLYQP